MRVKLTSVLMVLTTGALVLAAAPAAAAAPATSSVPRAAGAHGPALRRHSIVPGTWSQVPAPSPFNQPNPTNQFNAVSCGGPSLCVAVGASYNVDAATSNQFAAQWNGTAWGTIDSLTPQPSATNSVLNGVSCVSGSFCMAVGGVENASSYTTEAEVWDGTSWGGVPSPDDGGGAWGNSLIAVSCTSSAFCVAIDAYRPGLGPYQYLIYQWNGSSWASTAPVGLTSGASLSGVSCVGTWCQVVGQDASLAPLAFVLAGGTWSAESPPAGTAHSGLLGVSCVSTTVCTAVGFQFYLSPNNPSLNDQYSQNLVEEWNGTAWTQVTVPDQSAAFGDQLESVDCLGPTSCVAGGYAYTNDAEESVNQVLAWNGATWAVQVTPNPAASTSNEILGMACVANHQCLSVGYSDQATAALSAPVTRTGYYLVASDGGIFAFQAPFYGSMGGHALNKPIVAMAVTPDGGGYWEVGSDGGIFAFGDAGFYGSTGGMTLNKPIVGMAPTPDGGGYWLVGSDGGIFAFGDALFYGSTGGVTLNKPIVGMAPSADGGGYWLVASDGGIFSFGDVLFYGSTGGVNLTKPIVGMAPSADAMGYWLVGADGGIFSFGDAVFYGSTGGMTLNEPIVGMAATPDAAGYWLVGSDGGVFSFGDAVFYGSTGGMTLNAPIVGMAA